LKKVEIYMIKEIKLKIIDVLEDLNQTKDTIVGVFAFLKTEEDANEMLLWLEENKDKKLTQHEIIDKLDVITM